MICTVIHDFNIAGLFILAFGVRRLYDNKPLAASLPGINQRTIYHRL